MTVQNLNEAYASIYAPREISEEAQIAAHYFDSIGLNEEGVEYVIEHLGLEDFVNFVYEIVEEYQLTEARRGPGETEEKIEPVTAKGQPFKGGKPTKKGLERLQSLKKKRKEAEEAASVAKPSGMKAALRRQDAIVAASKRQPKKPGALDRIAGAINRGIERHNAATKKWAPVGQGLKDAAGKIGRGLATAAKAAVSEDFEAWVYELVNEGYDLSEYTWDEMAEIYMEEVENLNEVRITRSMGRRADKYNKDKAQREYMERLKAHQEKMENDPEYRAEHERLRTIHTRAHERSQQRSQENQNESYDLYDYILDHLISEGYADDVDSALVMMSNMSEEWRESIVEGYQTVSDHAAEAMRRREASLRPGAYPGDVGDNWKKSIRMRDAMGRAGVKPI